MKGRRSAEDSRDEATAEMRRLLRQAGALLAASDLDTYRRPVVLRRARAHVAASLAQVDALIDVLDAPVLGTVTDASVVRHRSVEVDIPSLPRLVRHKPARLPRAPR